MQLVITIDTEEDDQWRRQGPPSVQNIRFVPPFQELCQRYGFKPTYLCTYEVARSSAFEQVLLPLEQAGAAEIGAHLHAWSTPPIDDLWDAATLPASYASEIPTSLYRWKMESLTALLRQRRQAERMSYRGGRWGLSAANIELLLELGCVVDCSVTPSLNWEDPGARERGQDYRGAPLRPYYVSWGDPAREGASPLLEVPVTVVHTNRLVRESPVLASWYGRNRKRPVARLLNRSFRVAPQWFRPFKDMTADRLYRVYTTAQSLGLPVVQMTFHSSEMMPGGSPHNETPEDVAQLFAKLEDVFSRLATDGVEGVTLSSFADAYRSRHPQLLDQIAPATASSGVSDPIVVTSAHAGHLRPMPSESTANGDLLPPVYPMRREETPGGESVLGDVRRVSRQVLAYGTADVSVLAVNALLLPVYTRVLSPAEYGVAALLLVFEAFLKPVLRCGLDGAFLRHYFDEKTDSGRASLAWTVLLFLPVANGAVLLFLLPGAAWITHLLLGTSEYTLATRLVAVNTALANVLFLPLGLLRAREQSAVLGGVSFARSFATTVFRLGFVVGMSMGVYGLVVADVVVTSLFVAGLAPTLARMVRGGTFSSKRLWSILKFGAPQVPAGILAQTMAMTDRYVLGLHTSLGNVGVYSIGTTISSIVKLFPVAYGTAWMPFAFSSLDRTDARQVFARQASYAFAVLCFGAVGIVASVHPVIQIFLPVEYHGAASVVAVLVLGIGIQATTSFTTTSLNVAKRTSVIPVTAAAGALGSLLGCVALVPRFGVMGAALGVLCGQTIFATVTAWFAQRSYRIPYEIGRLAKVVAVSTLLVAVSTLARPASPWADLGLSAVLVCSYPVLLWAWGFLSPLEKRAVRQLAGEAVSRGRRDMSGR